MAIAEPSDALRQFLDRHREQTPISTAELLHAFEWSCRLGSGNVWAGSHGEAARIIRTLLIEIERLRCQ